ncbi:MAG: FAD-binding protein, partial [Burkholderiales bacterium]
NPAGRTGAPLTQALRTALSRFPNVTFANRTPGAGLLTDQHGAVVGVLAGAAGTERIAAKKVILATDGFGANKDMLRTFIPEMADVEYIGAQGNTGDGIRWALALGAAVEYMSGYQGHGYICPGYGTRLAPEMPFVGSIIVNADGVRFDREDQGYSELARVVLAQPRGIAICIFDQRVHDTLAASTHFGDSIAAGALRKADSLDALATTFRIDPARLRTTWDAYYEGVRQNNDPFGRQAFGAPLTPPYYGATITGGLAHTQGGLVVDAHARVLREDGGAIPNLYAGGGTAAGVSGDGPDGYLSGNGLLTAFGYGLIAGEHAADAIIKI